MLLLKKIINGNVDTMATCAGSFVRARSPKQHSPLLAELNAHKPRPFVGLLALQRIHGGESAKVQRSSVANCRFSILAFL